MGRRGGALRRETGRARHHAVYHNHHVDLIRFGEERIFDLVRRVAPSLYFEVDLHWVQRGGMAPLDMLQAYTGVCKLIHVKDFRVVPFPADALARRDEMSQAEFYDVFTNLVQFAEVGQGNMNWPKLLPAGEAAGPNTSSSSRTTPTDATRSPASPSPALT